MVFVSLTRLRIRSIRFLPVFALHTVRTLRQVRKSPGFQTGALLPDRSFTFWTLTLWDTQEDMRRYITTGDHKIAMPRLLDWCDEASIAHWTQTDATVPTWLEADHRMRTEGRISKVRNPSPQHATMAYRAPRTTLGGPIHRA